MNGYKKYNEMNRSELFCMKKELYEKGKKDLIACGIPEITSFIPYKTKELFYIFLLGEVVGR